jgi:dephospho-CoA kinase
MLKIALTGNICSGKTSILNIFSSNNIPVFNSDFYIAEIIKSDQEIQNFISNLGLSTKNQLSDFLFSNPKKLQEFEEIIYPKLRYKRLEFYEKNQNASLVVVEVPLLFEKNLQNEYDYIILAYAPKDIRVSRLENRKISREKFEKISLLQISDEEKLEKVNIVINTNNPRQKIKEKVSTIISNLSK